MKILFVLELYYPHLGGVETQFQNIAEALAKNHKVTILTSRLKGTKNYEKINSVDVVRVNVPKFLNRYFFTILAIPAAIALGKNADIIHTTTYNASLPARISAIINKKPSIITVNEVIGKAWYELPISKISSLMHCLLEKIIVNLKFDWFVAISNATMKSMIDSGVPKNKISVIYPGLDYGFFDSKKHDGAKVRKKLGLEKNFVYISYGRPGITKGIEYLIRSVQLISNSIPDSKLLLILSQSPKDRYKKIISLIHELKVEKHIVLVLPQDRIMLPSYIKSADCVVVPSLTEGFGYTAAEASALGVPVVASNVGSLPEVVSGKYLFVPSKNPTAIAKAVLMIKEGKYMTKPLKKFTVEESTRQYIMLYKKLCARF